MGLWLTVCSCETDIKNFLLGVDYKYHIVANGEEKISDETKFFLENLEKSGHLGSFCHIPEPMSPPNARNKAASGGKGDFIFFLDNHCIVEPHYFEYALGTFDIRKADAVHSATLYTPGLPLYYHYRLTLERNFWGYQLKEAPSRNSYQIAAGAHGGWAIRRSVWQELGGYWYGFSGYGGEETYFDLKMAMLDKTNYLNPNMIHWHHHGMRAYERDRSDDFIKNMMMAANIIGGHEWARRVKNGLLILERRERPENERNIEKFYDDALTDSAVEKCNFWRLRKRNLNEQLVKFAKDKVAI